MNRILFVCLGNICRSPLAEGIARSVIARDGYDIGVDSAGTGAWHVGEAPCPNSIRIAAQHGIDISHLRARQVDIADKKKFDYVIALDATNKRDLEKMGFRNVLLLGDFGGYGGKDVPDPYYFNGFEGFEKVYAMIEKAVEDLIKKVANELR